MCLIPMIDQSFDTLSSTLNVYDAKEEISALIDYFDTNLSDILMSCSDMPLLLHSALLHITKIFDISAAKRYLSFIIDKVQESSLVGESGAKLYFLVNVCLLHLQLMGMHKGNKTYLKMYAFCFLCFDYNKMQDRLV